MPHVLIVDDEPDLADLLAFNLNRAGFTTTLAHTGEEALERALAAPPDLILLDLMLPDMSGAEVYRQLRAASGTREVPVLVLTAHPDAQEGVAGAEVLLKPFVVREVVARVASHFRSA
jgi:two-component system phosphate regulon response regulator PhoB